MTTDTEPPSRYVRALDWARIASLLALPATAVPADVITAIEDKTAVNRALADREHRSAALRDCHRCDDFGWLLDELGLPAEPARKCDHGRAARRDPAPQHDPPRCFTEPIHPRTDTEEP